MGMSVLLWLEVVYSKDTLYNDSAVQSREQKRKKFNEHTCGMIYKFNFGCNALFDGWTNSSISFNITCPHHKTMRLQNVIKRLTL